MPQLIITSDGSHTVFLPQSGVTFHSRHGALAESTLIFITYGLMKVISGKNNVRIFEMGFGTGLNALLSLIAADSASCLVDYHTVESAPLPPDLYRELNYCRVLAREDKQNSFDLLHSSPWNISVQIDNHFQLLKLNGEFDGHMPGDGYDLVYWDAFDPVIQPAFWSEDIFTMVRLKMNHGAILLTYCSKTIVQLALRRSGFAVEKLPGPHGKREILRATAV